MDKELELMRGQLALLQNKLDKEVTLREETLRKLLKKGAHSFRNREIMAIIIVAFAMLVVPPSLYVQQMSPALCIFTGVSFMIGLIYNLWLYNHLHLGNILDQNLLQAQDDLQRYHRFVRKGMCLVGFPWILIWIGWYGYETYMLRLPDIADMSATYHAGYLMGMYASMAVGGLIGGLIGYLAVLRPQMKLAREMQEQIADLSRDENIR